MVTDLPERQKLVQAFIDEHVLRHAADGRTWNLPFLHVPFLDWLRYDAGMLVAAILLVVLLAGRAARRHRPAPSGLANAVEAYVVFIRDQIAIANLGDEECRRLTSYFCSLFLFVLALNLLGLVPFNVAATGSISVTCALAGMFLLLTVAIGLVRRGPIGFLKAFVPAGAPRPILPLLVPVEVVSLLARAFALMVRLFANMLVGHILVLAFLGLAVLYTFLSLPLVLLVVALLFFELFVAIFQAYIFTLLSAIFMGLVINPEH